jgi:hypothetical protein
MSMYDADMMHGARQKNTQSHHHSLVFVVRPAASKRIANLDNGCARALRATIIENKLLLF